MDRSKSHELTTAAMFAAGWCVILIGGASVFTSCQTEHDRMAALTAEIAAPESSEDEPAVQRETTALITAFQPGEIESLLRRHEFDVECVIITADCGVSDPNGTKRDHKLAVRIWIAPSNVDMLEIPLPDLADDCPTGIIEDPRK